MFSCNGFVPILFRNSPIPNRDPNRKSMSRAGGVQAGAISCRKMAMQRAHSVSSDCTSFRTKEGTYKKGTFQYCRETRKSHSGKEVAPVTVSFVSCKDKEGTNGWITFNSAKEFYFYPFHGMRKYPDLTKPADKRTYRSPTIPACHDFNLLTRSTEKLDLVLGFSTGPLQYVNPIAKRSVCAFNDDCSIDKSRVTCVKWVPGSESQFVSSHRSGHLYVWSTVFTGKATGPVQFVPHSELQDAVISTVKTKHKPALLFRWSIGHGAINSFAFSPDSEHIAIGSQDGFMRIYHFKTQQFHSRMRSYFGGVGCVCWSPDGCYVVTGGEDDLVTVWSFHHRRVVARGEGHQSYVTAVAFDPYTTVLPDTMSLTSPAAVTGVRGSEEALVLNHTLSTVKGSRQSGIETSSIASSPFLGRIASEAGERDVLAYRLGSVGQDGQLCLWDLSEDALKIRRPFARSRSRPSRMISNQPQSMAVADGESSAVGVTSSLKRRINEQDGAGGGGDGVHEKEDETNTRPRSDALIQEMHKSQSDPQGQDTSLTHNATTDDHAQQNTTQDLPSTTNETQPDDGESRESHSQSNTDKENSPTDSNHSKTEKKKNGKGKVKIKDGKKVPRGHQKALRDPMKRVMKFVGIGGQHNHNNRREVSAFETCNSDDIAPKMDEVNLIEPLVAERVDRERLSDLVFRDDCIVVASYDGMISLWGRPGVQTGGDEEEEGEGEGGEEVKQTDTHSNQQPDTHPGLNSPRPGGGPSSPLKQTTV